MLELQTLIRLAQVLTLTWQTGVGTGFAAHDDPQNPNPNLACFHRPLSDEKDVVVAHPTLPCRSAVVVCVPRTGRCIRATVGDRGPYGKNRDGTARAVLDLAPQTRKALGHNGKEEVLILSQPDDEGGSDRLKEFLEGYRKLNRRTKPNT